MSANRSKRNNRRGRHPEVRYTVRGVRRDPPDIRKLSKALLGLAMAEAEREAQAEHEARHRDADTTDTTEAAPDSPPQEHADDE